MVSRSSDLNSSFQLPIAFENGLSKGGDPGFEVAESACVRMTVTMYLHFAIGVVFQHLNFKLDPRAIDQVISEILV